MERRTLGSTGLQVSALCLGVAFRNYPTHRTEGDCVDTIERALNAGIDFIDCANVYAGSESERMLGRTIKRIGNREQLVVTTKVGSGDRSIRGLSRANILRQVDNSLRRLQMDYVDIYYLHEPDAEVALEETLEAMDEVVRQGKARFVGVSNHAAAEIVEMLWTAEQERLAPPAVLQFQYSLIHRWDTESDVVPLCNRHGLGLATYSPLAVGLLAGARSKYWSDHANGERMLAYAKPIVAELTAVAGELDKTPAQVAVAWLLANPAVSAPILGPDLPVHVDELVGAVGWQLPTELKQQLDDASAGGAPFEMFDVNWRYRRQVRSRRPADRPPADRPPAGKTP